jgi:hypothetical protein
LPDLTALRVQFGPAPGSQPQITVNLAPLSSYDVLATVHGVEPASNVEAMA